MSRSITWLGHATVRLDLGGVNLVTDPVLRARVAHLSRRVPLPPPASTEGLDAVLISHVHRDHLDLPSLRALGLPIVAPSGAARLLDDVAPVIELNVGESTTVGGVRVTATPAEHHASRGGLVPSLGFVIDRDIYFAGDTDVFAAMNTIGPLTLALLPVWGWGTSLGAGHLDPERAAATLPLLQPRLAAPIHWGTYFPAPYGLRGHPLLHQPPRQFACAAARVAPATDVHILAPGEQLVLDA